MDYKNNFKRYELKYLITREQRDIIKRDTSDRLRPDEYGKSNIRNLYYDTPDFLLARRSLEKPVYKEKLRVRSYGTAAPDGTVFVEIKRKYNDVVYKRRVAMTSEQAELYTSGRIPAPEENQITRELDYFMSLYSYPAPRVFLSYDREAYYADDDGDFRVTYDENILWRDIGLSLCKDAAGHSLLPEGTVLMEIKTGTAIPLYFVKLLSGLGIRKTSYSKYGEAYTAKVACERKDDIRYYGKYFQRIV